MSKFYIEKYESKFNNLIRSALETGAPVLDVGRGEEFGENQFRGYKVEPPIDVDVITCDVRSEATPRLIADLSQLPMKDSEFSIVFIESVLELVSPVSKVNNCLNETHRILID